MGAEIRFRAMGSDAHVVVVADDPARAAVVALAPRFVEDLEARWSRFRPTSEVARLNAAAGRPVPVSPPTLELVERALEGHRMTGGAFDPTVLGAVLEAGYDRDLVDVIASPGPSGRAPASSGLRTGADVVIVDREAGTVALPRGVGFDPGGIGKGLAADLLVDELLRRGVEGVCVNLGGDLRAEGVAPAGDAWVVAIDHPVEADPIAQVGIRGGAVATSSRLRRAWGTGEGRRHHLIDPATGRPAGGSVWTATAIAGRAWQAEVAAKAAFVGGIAGGLAALERIGVEGVLVAEGGAVHATGGFGRFLAGGAAARSPVRIP